MTEYIRPQITSHWCSVSLAVSLLMFIEGATDSDWHCMYISDTLTRWDAQTKLTNLYIPEVIIDFYRVIPISCKPVAKLF